MAKPGSAGKAGINQHTKVVKLNAQSPNDVAAADEVGQIIALLAGDKFVRGPIGDAPTRTQERFVGGGISRATLVTSTKTAISTSQAVSTT